MFNNFSTDVVKVFVNKDNKFGNPVGIIRDDKFEINSEERQKITTSLGYSETVFIDNYSTGVVSIYNPQKEVQFAGHAMVGTAWFINKDTNPKIDSLKCKGGLIKTWEEGDLIWINANLAMTPPWNYEQLASASEVERLSVSEASSKQHVFVWAWIDKDKGIVRARTFAPDWGIPEDEANGSGSMKLSATLGRDLEVIHGKGSIIYTRSKDNGIVEVGGKVMMSNKV